MEAVGSCFRDEKHDYMGLDESFPGGLSLERGRVPGDCQSFGEGEG